MDDGMEKHTHKYKKIISCWKIVEEKDQRARSLKKKQNEMKFLGKNIYITVLDKIEWWYILKKWNGMEERGSKQKNTKITKLERKKQSN